MPSAARAPLGLSAGMRVPFTRLLLLSLLSAQLPRRTEATADSVTEEALASLHELAGPFVLTFQCKGDTLDALVNRNEVHLSSLTVAVVKELCALGVPVMQQGVRETMHADAAGDMTITGVQLPQAMWHTLAAAHGNDTLALLAQRASDVHIEVGDKLRKEFVAFGSRKHLRLQWAAVGVYARPMVHFVHENTVSGLLNEVGEWEGLQTELLQALLRPGDVAVDLGAHIGTHTVAMALAVQPGGVVHAFEPQPGVWEVLRANVELNDLSRIVITHNAAVDGPPPSPSADADAPQRRVCLARDIPTRQHGSSSSTLAEGVCTSRLADVPLLRMGGVDEDPRDECGGVVVRLGGNFGGLSMAACGDEPTGAAAEAAQEQRGESETTGHAGAADATRRASESRGQQQPRRVQSVPVVSVDEFQWDGDACPRLMKLDLEGMELAVLRGSELTIARCRPILHVENNIESVSRQLIPLLHSWSYDMYWEVSPFTDHVNYFGRTVEDTIKRAQGGMWVDWSVNVVALPRELNVSSLPAYPRELLSRMRAVDRNRVLLREYTDGVMALERAEVAVAAHRVAMPDGTSEVLLTTKTRASGVLWHFAQEAR